MSFEESTRQGATLEPGALEAQHRGLLESISDAIVVTDPDYVIQTWNAAAVEMYGWSANDAIGRSMRDLVPIEYPTPKDAADTRAQLSETGRWKGEVRQARRDGSWFQVQASVDVIHDDEGQPVRIVAVNRDVTKRVEAAAELKRTEALYRSIVGSLSEGLTVQDDTDTIVWANESAARILGLSMSQLLGKDSFDPQWRALREDDTPFGPENHPTQITLRTGQPVDGTIMKVRTGDGKQAIISVNSRPVFDDEGNVVRAVATFADITARKQAEESLLLRNLVFDASIAACIVCDTRGFLTEMNQAALDLWCFASPAEVVGQHASRFFETPREAQAIWATLDESGAAAGRFTARRKGETSFVAEYRATVLRDRTGKHVGYQTAIVDVSDQVRAQGAIRESEARYRALFEANTDPILVADVESRRFVNVNRAGCAWLGYERDELLELSVPDIHPPESRQDVLAGFQKEADGGPAVVSERACQRKDGAIVHAEISSSLMTLDDRLCLVGFFRDVSDRRLVTELRKKSQELVAFNEAMLDRESRIIELKEEVNTLCEALERTVPYPPLWDEVGSSDWAGGAADELERGGGEQ